MFTGIVETMGTVVGVMRRGGGARLVVRAPELKGSLGIGDSVAVNGACVTVTEANGEVFACDLVPETVARTNLGILAVDEEVNLERPVRATDRLGGHIVQGHVDAVGVVRSRRKVGAQEMLEVTVPFELTRYLAAQGSVSLDGVSLTVVAVDKDRFRVALIPHTVAVTTLGRKGQGGSVNVEVDVLSKYVERHLVARAGRPAVFPTEEPPKERETAPARSAPPRPTPKPAGARSQSRPAQSRSSAARATSSSRTVRAAGPSKRPVRKPAKGARRPAAKRPARAAKARRRAAVRRGRTRGVATRKPAQRASRPLQKARGRRR